MINFFLVKTSFFFNSNFFLFKRLFLVSLEYKSFVYRGVLYVLLGNANYLLINIPNNILVICRKKKIYLFLLIKDNLLMTASFFTFLTILQKLKNINIYKGKGLIASKNFNLVRLKKGKKQQFM